MATVSILIYNFNGNIIIKSVRAYSILLFLVNFKGVPTFWLIFELLK